jgi:FlaA1/EpsC-like NDP-sugar epimerase
MKSTSICEADVTDLSGKTILLTGAFGSLGRAQAQ